MAKVPKEKTLIGRRERIDLPEFNLTEFEAKVDTGAYTSALHCSHIALTERNGRPWLTFHIPGPRNQGVDHLEFGSENFESATIRSSTGHLEQRYVISTRVRVAGRVVRTRFSLADRTEMRYPILLGRRLLRGRFIVDVSGVELAPNPSPVAGKKKSKPQ